MARDDWRAAASSAAFTLSAQAHGQGSLRSLARRLTKTSRTSRFFALRTTIPLALVAAFSFAAQADEPRARQAAVVLAPPAIHPPPGCLPGEALPVGELERLRRFAAVPNAFTEWERRNCYPRRVDERTLASVSSPVGVIVTLGEQDLLVVDPGTSWLAQCSSLGLVPGGTEEVTGSDLVGLLEAIAATPELVGQDLREIGLAKGQRRGGGNLFALYLGTPKRIVHLQCFEEIRPMVGRAAEALRGSSR